MSGTTVFLCLLGAIVFICGFELSYTKNGKTTHIVKIKALSERFK